MGVREKISAESLLLFAEFFYEALASDTSVQGAFDNARESLKTLGLEGSDAMVLRVQNGKSATIPFLSSMGFLDEGIEEVPQVSEERFRHVILRRPKPILFWTHFQRDSSLNYGLPDTPETKRT